MTNLKPVWRMNTDHNIPVYLGDLHMTENGCIYPISRHTKNSRTRWNNSWGEWNIIAYQTTRTKPAKYRKARIVCVNKGCQLCQTK